MPAARTSTLFDDPTVPYGASPWCPLPSEEPTQPRVQTVRRKGLSDGQLAVVAAGAGASATAATAFMVLSCFALIVLLAGSSPAPVERSLQEVLAAPASAPVLALSQVAEEAPVEPVGVRDVQRRVVMLQGMPPSDPVSVDVEVDDPAAAVFIDGQEIGVGPQALVVDSGPHEVRVLTGRASGSFRLVAEPNGRWCFSTEGRAVRPVACASR